MRERLEAQEFGAQRPGGDSEGPAWRGAVGEGGGEEVVVGFGARGGGRGGGL